LESKISALTTPSHFEQSRPKLKLWTPTRLNLMAVWVMRKVSWSLTSFGFVHLDKKMTQM